MAKYSMQDLKELREETGAGLADVKKALEEAEGDREKALQIIRVKGLKSLSKREGRSAGMGLIAAKITDTAAGQRGTLVEVNAETDFVVKTEKFINMAEVVLQAAAESGASTTEELMKAKTADGTVKDTIDAVAAIIGEKLDVANVRQVEGEAVDVYLHKSSQDLPPTVGVLVATDKAGAGVAHDVAMHIAAYSPEYLSRDEVPAEAVEKERETLTEATIAEGKPEAAVAKIVEGKMNGFFKENVLLDQPYAKDPKTTVGKIVEASKGKVTGFARLQAGE
ncbi:translation elongation factor Ts [Mobiluncus mulieris]|uniref:Elongation factor Ts n=2 Tax=Mobiluncus mulieris TaxID=2052 RepID=E0QSX8_9ACTO|nr:translation elongation factor Ts [Mobiluncus mulieris]EEJ53660.1 translation elongation factor Ts [Mobiluncus mulieris ATCC 35243]EEZ90457.1 translation elongation factor Ts [Mobiluncus mulieris 28-1]EFM45317.1 translation elongation factor Ts [Mobiluncus mulieris ATCC 35239]EFN93829.1 translation elongation factor Ts [Mobiluncus mulieris FB024-16]MBB5845590.1 elongation factor Ts [Mobiluncus mulieris]